MGNRANVRITPYGDESGDVYLYTHWGGLECTTKAVARALKELPGRWSDDAYLARGILARMVDDQEADPLGETGFGIATYMPDNENDILIVDCKRQEVRIHASGTTEPEPGIGVPFDQFTG